MENKSILEPLNEYNSVYKNLIRENADKFYKDLVKKAETKVEENKETVKKYNQKLLEANQTKKKITKKNVLKGFMVFFIIVFFLLIFYCSYNIYKYCTSKNPSQVQIILNPILTVVFLGLAILFIILIVKKLNPLIKELENLNDKLNQEAEALLKEAYAQMQTLNDSFDYNMIKKVVMKTTPLIQIDDYFDIKKYYFLKDKYGYDEQYSDDTSICGCLSGSIVGNPFLYVRTFNMELINKTYTGTRVITWTVTDSKGNTQVRSQTLVAHYTAPAPTYYYSTKLIYSNEAAPDLSFSREPSGAKGKDEKGIKKLIKSKIKDMQEIEEDSMKNDDHSNIFTPLSNTEFDALFGAFDRDNEVQFRLLFTPLAQNNMMDLLVSQEPYGDEYYFVKEGYINYIVTDHMKDFDMGDGPFPYISYSYEISKDTFINNCSYFFQSLYFDLIPLLNIPLYQQYKTQEYIYQHEFKENFTTHEVETIANSFSNNPFSNPLTTTRTILKSSLIRKENDNDKVLITAHSFQGLNRTIYIPTMCSNGRMYDVPVNWIEYIPLEQETPMEVKECKESRNNFNININSNSNISQEINNSNSRDYLFQRGLLGIILYNIDNFNNTNDNE